MIDLKPFIKNRWVVGVGAGYLLTLLCIIGIVHLSFTGLNNINATVNDITYRLTSTRSLAQQINNKLQTVHLFADRYQRFYKQKDLDSFYVSLLALEKDLQKIDSLVAQGNTKEIVEKVQEDTQKYMNGFNEIAELIMHQQSLLSTTLIKKELLLLHNLSALRINVGLVQNPAIFYSFGNARNAFDSMRLYQSKYLSSNDEKFFLMFKRQFELAIDAFSDLTKEMQKVSHHSDDIIKNILKASKELEAYYATFVEVHSANLKLKALSKAVDLNKEEVTNVTHYMIQTIESEYRSNNTHTKNLVEQTKLQLISVVSVMVFITLILFIIVLNKIVAPEVRKLRQLSNIDSLTQIANRRAFDAQMLNEFKETMNTGKYISVIMCDVDFFKDYNDEYGHLMGDECLQKIAQTLSDSCEGTNNFVARYGGEEFILILPNTAENDAMIIADKLRLCVEGLSIDHAKSPISRYVTISIGVATTQASEGSRFNDVVHQADSALYEAKNNHRNCVVSYR